MPASSSDSPPAEFSTAPEPSSVPVPTATVSSSVKISSFGGRDVSFDDEPEGRRRSSRLSSRSSSYDPMDIIPDDDEFPTPADSLSPSHSPPPDGVPGPIPIRKYGGFPSLNWQTYRQDLNNFTPKCYYARDLPHTLQDHINRWPESARLHPQMRHVLQSAILENTADDEPDAPYIEIINNIDHEPTPPWEFHYSNKMWHTDGVPPPDVTKLTSCGCMGKCDPKSKTCACIKRQQHYASDVYPDFAYDKNGRLRLPGYPIFECNDLCGCDDECRNRVPFFLPLLASSLKPFFRWYSTVVKLQSASARLKTKDGVSKVGLGCFGLTLLFLCLKEFLLVPGRYTMGRSLVSMLVNY
jgi:Pre-SET motif